MFEIFTDLEGAAFGPELEDISKLLRLVECPSFGFDLPRARAACSKSRRNRGW